MLTVSSLTTVSPSPATGFPRFGFAGGFVSGVDRGFQCIQKTRTREMLVEDVVGYGFLRTMMDAFRQYMFKSSALNKREINYAAARERLFRELMSIVTDNISGGLVAVGVGAAANRLCKTPNFSNAFIGQDTRELFQGFLAKSDSPSAFLKHLAQAVSPESRHTPAIYEILQNTMAKSNGKDFAKVCQDAAVTITQRFKADKSTLDVMIGKTNYALDTLIEDAAHVNRFIKPHGAARGHWGQNAARFFAETARVNRWQLFLGMGVALCSTLLVPYLNHLITRRIDNIKSYPGEKGLTELKTVRRGEQETFFERNTPYLRECVREKKLLPLLLTTVPLLAFFLIDTVKLSTGRWRSAILNPLAGKAYFKRLVSMLEFGRGFPFTTQQQMASCYAFLIFSRLISSRTENEFRERFVDSLVLGWTVWILATPLLKRLFARRLGAEMLKTVNRATVLKRRVEIERLLHNVHEPGAVRSLLSKFGTQKLLGKFVLLSAGTTLTTMGILGIVEPYVALKWTEYRAEKKRRRLQQIAPEPVYQQLTRHNTAELLKIRRPNAPWAPPQQDVTLPYFNLAPRSEVSRQRWMSTSAPLRRKSLPEMSGSR